MNKLSQQELMRQGIAWLRLHYTEVLELYLRELSAIPSSYIRLMSNEKRHRLAVRNLDSLILRLEGGTLPLDEFKNIFLQNLQQGARLPDLAITTDRLLYVVTTRAERDLAGYPDVYEALLKKAAYVNQLFKTSMSAALIEFEGQKAAFSSWHSTL